jgi:AcrR family transcriptional regulator
VAGTREQIVTSTIDVLRMRGYAGTTLKHISHASGATVGSIYHFFPGGKDDLVIECLESAGASYLELFFLIAAEHHGPGNAISALFDGGADVLAMTDYFDLCPISTVASETASCNDRIRSVSARVFESWIAAFSSAMQAEGLADTVALELGTAVIAMFEGAITLSRTARDPEPLRSAGRACRRLIDASMVGVTPPLSSAAPSKPWK